ncbi:DEAD/DEAH box helicase [Gynurincola endophyticus]|uniref:DEAD/DEAH box helicase n=1 Tax=Gynurincola endophyticus TaxID=2479004 RepID=UPI000F8EB737|nr:ATP-binding domain-containing protein [Gynurincola endophyticus]
MEKNLLYIQINENTLNKGIIKEIKKYSSENPRDQIYVINAPLGDKKYSYSYQESTIVILSPNHKLLFVDLEGDDERFNEFCDDFLEDLSSISDKYDYKRHIGRPRAWKENNTIQIYNYEYESIELLFENNRLNSPDLKRISELIISLLIGSINDIARVGAVVPETLLEKVKKNIILFDGEQTRFIYKEFNKKSVSIQGLSGTGKTELLLHKLKEIYTLDDKSKIFFTCHNITLSNNLRERVPHFFNFMRVEKQIEWNKRLWVSHAWGSKNQPDSGLYSYLCNFYNVPFLRYNNSIQNNYETIFTQILEVVNSIKSTDFKFAFDYILIDERQDFPKIFFELCEKVARKKVYIAGDIFQDIFENTDETELEVDIVLNRCYRTDPRTLMFAHGVGLGLFEKRKLNWFSDNYWNAIGYEVERRRDRLIRLHREPIRRFENLSTEDFESVIIRGSNYIDDVINIISDLIKVHKDLKPDDIAIIILEENRKNIYDYIDKLIITVEKKLGWSANRVYENKSKVPGTLFISNHNNVKGLEFPFVICLTAAIKDTYKYRNILYTMLTRSFIQSYLLVDDKKGVDQNREGLDIINKHCYIQTIEPSSMEKKEIVNKLKKFIQNSENISYDDFIKKIFDELNVPKSYRTKLINALLNTDFDKFDKDKTVKFIKANIEFYSS